MVSIFLLGLEDTGTFDTFAIKDESLTVTVFFPCVCEGYSPTDSAALRSALFSNYSSKDRPQNNTDVYINFGLFHITGFDIIAQRLSCIGFFLSTWNDSRLMWNASDYNNLVEFFTPLSDVWSPIIVLSNAADEITIINDNEDLASTNVYITGDGLVEWISAANIDAQCTVNIKYYPFDKQDCVLAVSSWGFLERHVNLEVSNPEIFYDLYEESGEWAILGSSVKDNTRKLGKWELSSVNIHLNLKRKYSYYLLNMLLPVIILALMGPFAFVLPVESGEKIGFTLTILLSLSVVLTIVSDSIPPTSTHVCLLSVYLVMTFLVCSIETMLTLVSCTFHEYHNRGTRMGKRLNKLTGLLARITIYRKPVCKDKEIGPESNMTACVSGEIDDKKREAEENMKKAWDERSEKSESNGNEGNQYTYDELVILLDRFNFYLFFIIVVLKTVIFIIVSGVGGSS